MVMPWSRSVCSASGFVQQAADQRGLAMVDMADDHHANGFTRAGVILGFDHIADKYVHGFGLTD